MGAWWVPSSLVLGALGRGRSRAGAGTSTVRQEWGRKHFLPVTCPGPGCPSQAHPCISLSSSPGLTQGPPCPHPPCPLVWLQLPGSKGAPQVLGKDPCCSLSQPHISQPHCGWCFLCVWWSRRLQSSRAPALQQGQDVIPPPPPAQQRPCAAEPWGHTRTSPLAW